MSVAHEVGRIWVIVKNIERVVLAIQPKAGVLDANQIAHLETALRKVEKLHNAAPDKGSLKSDLWGIRQQLVSVQESARAT